MSEFKKFLAEASKQYDFVIKIAGELPESFENKLETALSKYEIANLSSAKKTPIQKLPLDFPELKNTEVTVYETTVNYPVTTTELKQYLADYFSHDLNKIRVRKPGEPYEEYQVDTEVKPYEAKLTDGEYKDAGAVDKDGLVTTEKGKESFLAGLAKEAKERFKVEV
jgi:hypothetical protein